MKSPTKKTTLELPDELMKRVKLRALRDGKKLKQTVTELLNAGMSGVTASRASKRSAGELVPKRLPMLKARPLGPTPTKFQNMTGQQMSDFIKDLQTQEDLERYAKTFGHQYVDRADGRKSPAPRRRS